MQQQPGVTGVAPVQLLSRDYELGKLPPHTTSEPKYGSQSVLTWTADDSRGERGLVDAMFSEYLWRVSVTGENILLKLIYGTNGTKIIDNITLPFEANIPGQVNIRARRLDEEAPARAVPTLTAATGGINICRGFFSGGAGGITLPPELRQVTALNGTSITVNGFGIAVTAGETYQVAGAVGLAAGGQVIGDYTL